MQILTQRLSIGANRQQNKKHSSPTFTTSQLDALPNEMDATEVPSRPQPLGLPPQLAVGGPQTATSITQVLQQHHQALQLNSLIANSQHHYHPQQQPTTQQQHQEHQNPLMQQHQTTTPTPTTTNRHPASDCMALAAALAASASFPHIHQQLQNHMVQHQQQQQQQLPPQSHPTPITRPQQPQTTNVAISNANENNTASGQANTTTSSTNGSCNPHLHYHQQQQQHQPQPTNNHNQVPTTQQQAQYYLNPATRVQTTLPTVQNTNNNINNNNLNNNISNSITSSVNQVAAQPSQVPLLNFNRCPATATVAQQISSNLSAPVQQQPPTPIVAHSNQFLADQGSWLNAASYQLPVNSNNLTSQPQQLNNTGNVSNNHRPLATNTTLNSVANQDQAPRPPIIQQQAPSQQQLPPPLGSLPALPNMISDDLNTLFVDHLRTILLNQFCANPRLAIPQQPIIQPVPQQQQQHQQHTPSAPLAQSNRSNVPSQVAPQQDQNARVQQVPQLRLPVGTPLQPMPQNMTTSHNFEQVSCQQTTRTSGTNNPGNATSAHNRLSSNQVPNTADSNNYSTAAPINNNNLYQPQQNTARQQPLNTAPIMNPVQQPATQQQATTQPSLAPQPSSTFPLYPTPAMEQALALFLTPQVAQNLIGHVLNIYWQGGLRQDPSHHYPPPHFHHHLHNSHHHHHHHHGANGQSNGQDGSMPLDSLAISESKPRGLTRVEIDSLTPFIQMNDKDSRTCVICLSKFELKSKIRPLPCNHAFHAKCVDKWLRANRTCPICRRDALKSVGKIKRI